MKTITLEEAVNLIRSNQKLFIHGGDATPKSFLDALARNSDSLQNVSLFHLHTHGDAAYADPQFSKNFTVKNFFVGGNVRRNFDFRRIDYIPCFLSEIPQFIKQGIYQFDVTVIQVSPPDKHGYVTLGTSVDVTKAAIEASNIVIAQINPRMPRVFGDGVLSVRSIDFAYEIDETVAQYRPAPLSDTDDRIGKNVAELIDDGSTLQVGIGAVPDAVINNLKHHKNLGLHSEMWTVGCLELLKSGAIDNSKKTLYPGKTLSSFIIGDKDVHDFVDDNLSVILKTADYVNNPTVIKRNPKMCAINSAVEVDLTGQICADSVGHRMISGVGGQMDFMRGASLSENGKPIIAIHSRTANGHSKIVPALKNGAGVVTTRAHAQYVVTEFGATNLQGKSLGERAKALIEIAHPEDREPLSKRWHEIAQCL